MEILVADPKMAPRYLNLAWKAWRKGSTTSWQSGEHQVNVYLFCKTLKQLLTRCRGGARVDDRFRYGLSRMPDTD